MCDHFHLWHASDRILNVTVLLSPLSMPSRAPSCLICSSSNHTSHRCSNRVTGTMSRAAQPHHCQQPTAAAHVFSTHLHSFHWCLALLPCFGRHCSTISHPDAFFSMCAGRLETQLQFNMQFNMRSQHQSIADVHDSQLAPVQEQRCEMHTLCTSSISGFHDPLRLTPQHTMVCFDIKSAVDST